MTTWREVPVPAKKADYRYKHLRLLAVPPADGMLRSPETPPLPVRINDVTKISMRRAAKDTWHVSLPDVSAWGDVRVLELEWKCPHCAEAHRILIPEYWIAEGKAVFVEAVTEESHV